MLHSLALQALLLGSRAHTIRPPDIQGLGAASIKSEVAPSDTLILIDLPGEARNDTALREDLTSAGATSKDRLVVLISPDPLPQIEIAPDDIGEEQKSETAADSEDPAARALLFGRYTGQIDARIKRAWRRPRSPVNPELAMVQDSDRRSHDDPFTDDTFRCQLRIIQDSVGRVQEVQLPSCNGSVAWQHSLIAAVLSASPLPAPPSPTVFTTALTMTFEGHAYTPGSLADEYEVESRPSILAASGSQRVAPHESDDSHEFREHDPILEPAAPLTGNELELNQNP